MALRILLDECILDASLMSKLREAGHDVATATELGLKGRSDRVVVEAARAESRLVLTLNCLDFLEISNEEIENGGSHPGFLLVFRYNNPSKDMSHDAIVKAIQNLEESNIQLSDACHSLNS